jgi:hypothetical protein
MDFLYILADGEYMRRWAFETPKIYSEAVNNS